MLQLTTFLIYQQIALPNDIREKRINIFNHGKTENIILQNAKGSIGKTLVVKQYGKKTVISKYPDMSGVKYNDLQKQEQSRFAEAVAYARSIIHDPVKKAEYQKKLPKGKRVYNAALQEYLKRA